jgi:hypothetical protein
MTQLGLGAKGGEPYFSEEPILLLSFWINKGIPSAGGWSKGELRFGA